MTERAGRWLRVSTGGQDEASQEPDIDKWIAGHEYGTGPAYRLHGKSASKGKQDKALNQVIADMSAGKLTVLVVWQSSRIERRGAYSVFDLARRVKEAGGRIEYVQDAYLNETNEMSDVLLALAATKDRQKSQDISKQVLASHNRIRANGGIVTKLPWGYKAAGPKLSKRPVTTPEGEKHVPDVYERIADGQTLPHVAAWLTGVTDRRWFAQTISDLIRNSAYRGQWHTRRGLVACPRLVKDELWNRANASLDGRRSSCRGRRAKDAAMPDGAAVLSGVAACGNPECDATTVPSNPDAGSPMYKITTRDGVFYRCSGRGTGKDAKRKGCGNLVAMAEADALMDAAMTGMTRPVLRPEFHPAEGHQVELDELNQKLLDLPARKLDRAAEQAERERIWGRQDELAALPAKAAWTEWIPVVDEAGEPVTYGSRWAASDPAERRRWLREDSRFTLALAKPGAVITEDEDSHPDELLARTDVWASDRAAIVLTWENDADEGLARGLA